MRKCFLPPKMVPKIDNSLMGSSEDKLHSLSMAPLIFPGERLNIVKAGALKVNDVVVFWREERLIAHRIIYTDPGSSYIITKGDNNLRADVKLYKKDILGKIELSHLYLTQSAVYLRELERLSEAFGKNKIEYVILKGLPVHIFVNHNPPERLYLDVDLLISPSSQKRAAAILFKLGYKKRKAELFGKKVKLPSQVTFLKRTKPFAVSIDLHLEPALGSTKFSQINILLPNLKPFNKYLFEEKVMVTANGYSFPVLSKEALFVYLCLHFFHHNFTGIHRLELINDLVRNKKLNWRKISKVLVKNRLRNFVFPSLLFLKRYYKTPIPKEFFESARPWAFPSFSSHILSLAISPFNSDNKTVERIKRLLLILLFSSPANFFS